MAKPLPVDHTYNEDCASAQYACRDHLDACRNDRHRACLFDWDCVQDKFKCLDADNVCRNRLHDACVLRPEEQHPECRAVGGTCLVGPRCDDCTHDAYMAYDCWKTGGGCLGRHGRCTVWEHNSVTYYSCDEEDEDEDAEEEEDDC